MNSFSDKSELWKAAYKLWHDGLALLLSFFFVYLLVECVVSGIFYSPLNLAYLTILIVLWTILGNWLSRKSVPAIEARTKSSSGIMVAMLSVLAVFLAWATLKFTWYESLVMVVAGLAIAYYLLRLIFQPEE